MGQNILESRIYNTRKAGENFLKPCGFLEQMIHCAKICIATTLQTIALWLPGKI